MRVIAGTARGTRLKAPRGMAVRPTADRVKEALFNIIGPRIIGALFIDLYAGSGSVGIEALSRGARSSIFVDNKKNNLALIRENLIKTRLEVNARLIMADVKKALTILCAEEVKADLIYLDPPYSMTDLSPVVGQIISRNIIADDGLIIVEHSHSNRQWADDFALTRQKKYGDTCLTMVSPP